MSYNYCTQRIGKILGLDAEDSECFNAIPLDVLNKMLDGLVNILKVGKDNQVAFPPQDITIFIVQYWAGNGQWTQDYFTCPVSAARRYQYVIANIPESCACISTGTVSTEQH